MPVFSLRGWLSVEPETMATQSIWEHWRPVWYGFFYGPLALAVGVILVGGVSSAWAGLVVVGLTVLLGLWYLIYARVTTAYWEKHRLFTAGYLALGWACWFALIIPYPVYLLLLFGLYPQAFLLPGVWWKVVAGGILSLLCLWREFFALGGFNQFFIVVLAISCSGIVLAVFISMIVQQSGQRYELVLALKAARRDVANAERQAGIMAERQRLAREIHDTLAQGFTSITMHLEAADGLVSEEQVALRQLLQQMQRTARENLAEARRLTWALQPEVFEQTSLPDVLTNLAHRWSEESEVATTVTVTGTAHPLLPEIEVIFLRVLQEGLANARKHAQATQVTITLSYMDDLVMLDVQDDGVGFEPAIVLNTPSRHSSGSFGLKAMRERLEQWHGTFVIESVAGEGTTLTVGLPLVSIARSPTRE